jgi:hypothetical protein
MTEEAVQQRQIIRRADTQMAVTVSLFIVFNHNNVYINILTVALLSGTSTIRATFAEWDEDNLCPYCQCCFLKDSDSRFREKCCLNGDALDPGLFPKLQPLPGYILRRVQNPLHAIHFALSSPYYNIFALGAVSVQNGRDGGFDHINGPHCTKMTGRTHHFMPRSQNGGLSYFTFDNLPAVRNHDASLNGGDPDGMRVRETFLVEFFEGLKVTNELVQQVMETAAHLRVREQNVYVEMATPVHQFEVAAVVSDRPGPLQIQYTLRNNETCVIPGRHKLWKPLSYPLLFPFGEFGWEPSWKRKNVSL